MVKLLPRDSMTGRSSQPKAAARVGIRDVARDAGVSVATVSRALANDGYPVAEETRRKIMASVKRLKFVPNDLARGLSQNRTNTIGVIVPNLSNLYYARVLTGIEDVAASNRLSIIFCNTNHSIEKREEDIRLLLQKRVDGILICGSGSDYHTHLDSRSMGAAPMVMLGRNEKFDGPSVQADNFQAGYTATRHLFDHGHRAIAFLAGPPSWADGSERIRGYKACLAERGIAVDDDMLIYGDFAEEDAYARLRTLGQQGLKFTAVVAGNDRIALGAMAAASDLGLRIPQDVAFVGFDNIATSSYVRPSLTTMDMPAQLMGAEAMRLLLRIMAGEQVPTQTIFDVPLLERQSSGSR
jgi:LacI family transcriptional regulator